MRILATALAVVLLAACSDDGPTTPEPGPDGLTAVWSGTSAGVIVEVHWIDDIEGAVLGCVAFGFDPDRRPEDRVIVPMTGVIASGVIELRTTETAAVDWSWDGTLQSDDRMSGTADGEAWANAPLSLTRQDETPSCP